MARPTAADLFHSLRVTRFLAGGRRTNASGAGAPGGARDAPVSQARERPFLGPIGCLGRIVGDIMDGLLPADAHQRCDGGRLNISVCRAEGPLWYTGLRSK
jgi:hypothetical protein